MSAAPDPGEAPLGRIRPYVDEVVVLDLESNDRSTQVALEYGARVYQGRFADDISSLRNAPTRRATSDWILVLDADELIDEQETHKEVGSFVQKQIPDDPQFQSSVSALLESIGEQA